MADFVLKYGRGEQTFSYPDEDVLNVVLPAEIEIPESTEEEKVRYAIENPLDCPTLEEQITADNTVCIIVPDTTRLWAHPHLAVKIVVEKLNKIGVPDKHILIMSATGTHKYQTEAEHRALVSDEIYDRITVMDNDCDRNLVKVGVSKRNNEIWLNKVAMSYDKRIIIGGSVFHFLAGFGGTRKYVLPGIAGRATIMSNHSQYFAEGGVGSGKNINVNPGQVEGNPISDEMYEAADMADICFTVTTVMGPDKNVAFAFAGTVRGGHQAAYSKCRALDGAEVDEAADLVITCGMGYPKDLNLYQVTAKPMINGLGALKPGKDSVLIVVAACEEGIGNPDTVMMLNDFDNAHDREVYTRENYTIGLNVAYMCTAVAEECHYILVSTIPAETFNKCNIHPVSTVEEAIKLAHELTGKEHLKATILPYGANTCCSVKAK